MLLNIIFECLSVATLPKMTDSSTAGFLKRSKRKLTKIVDSMLETWISILVTVNVVIMYLVFTVKSLFVLNARMSHSLITNSKGSSFSTLSIRLLRKYDQCHC